jgi:hypothetical protein
MSINRRNSVLARARAALRAVLQYVVGLSYRSSRAWTAFLS